MESMKRMFEKMLGTMNDTEKERFLEQCLTFLKGPSSGKDREGPGRAKEEGSPPERNRFAGCGPERMEEFFHALRNCLEENGRGKEDGKEKKPDRSRCC